MMKDHLARETAEQAFEHLENAMQAGAFPGYAAAGGIRDVTFASRVSGLAHKVDSLCVPLREDTRFDMASLTKVMVTLPVVLRLLEMGQIRLRDSVGQFIPEFDTDERRAVTLLHLLTHCSGLPAHRPYYQLGETPEERMQRVRDEPLVRKPGTAVVYSDIGFVLLGLIVETITGQRLDELARQYVFDPLKLDSAMFSRNQRGEPGDFASTEYRADLDRYMIGEVHDENAYALGGVSGHAGLFATLHDAVKYAKAWACGGASNAGAAFLSPVAVRSAIEPRVTHLGAARGLGWCLRGDDFDHMGDLWPQTGYGHTGFTGTSIAVDAGTGMWVVLLTQRVHYGRGYNMARIRAVFHNGMAAALAYWAREHSEV